jgi:hypothetical protein
MDVFMFFSFFERKLIKKDKIKSPSTKGKKNKLMTASLLAATAQFDQIGLECGI